jgi:hypothetical protein
MLFAATLFAALATRAAAHATFQELWVNGVDQVCLPSRQLRMIRRLTCRAG